MRKRLALTLLGRVWQLMFAEFLEHCLKSSFQILISWVRKVGSCASALFPLQSESSNKKDGFKANIPIWFSLFLFFIFTDEKLVHRTVDFDEGKKVLKQISFYDYTSIWGVDPDGISYVRNNGEWVKVDGLMNHISTGPSGTWAINRNSEVLYRQGSSVYKPEGIVWSKIDGSCSHILFYLLCILRCRVMISFPQYFQNLHVY